MSNDKDFKVKNGIQPTVYHEAVGTVGAGFSSTVGYSLSVAFYDSVSFSVADKDTSPRSVFFKPDGTKMYVLGDVGNSIYEYDLSTPWDMSTASYLQSKNVQAQETTPRGLFFSPDGTNMYVIGGTGDDVNQYTLTVPWNVAAPSNIKVFSVAAQEVLSTGIFFKPDGTKMYITGAVGQDVNEYNLSTAWDVTTASFLQNFNVSAQETGPLGIFFKPDGTKMYVVGYTGDAVYEYNLSTAWDISTASFLQLFSVAAQETVPYGIFFKPDGLKMYVIGDTTDTIYQYSTGILTAELDLSTGSVFEITPTSDLQVTLTNPAASGTSSGATLLLSAVGTAYTITYDTPIQFSEGLAPTAPEVGDTDVLTFNTTDGGITYKSALAIDGAS